MTEKKDMQQHKDSPPRDERKDARASDSRRERQRERDADQPGAAHAGATARADEDTYD